MSNSYITLKKSGILGCVTGKTPFVVQKNGRHTYITLCVRNIWNVYDSKSFYPMINGPRLQSEIRVLEVNHEYTFAATKSEIVVCKRGHKLGILRAHKRSVIGLLSVNDYLLSLGKDKSIYIWKIGYWIKPLITICINTATPPTCFSHPPAYVNKILVGFANGKIQLWDFIKGKLFKEYNVCDISISRIIDSSVANIVGIILSNDIILLFNIKTNDCLLECNNNDSIRKKNIRNIEISSLAFSSGNATPLMSFGNRHDITIWNLLENQLYNVIKNAHHGSITTLYFLPASSYLISSGTDNSLHEWFYNTSEVCTYKTKSRKGHFLPPTNIRFYREKQIISVGHDDAFLLFSTISRINTREISPRHLIGMKSSSASVNRNLKLPRVIYLDFLENKTNTCCDLITAHKGSCRAYTWSIGTHINCETNFQLKHEPFEKKSMVRVISVAISSCGNFGFIGTTSGSLERYNIESGLFRGSYRLISYYFKIRSSTINLNSFSNFSTNAHNGPVTHISCDYYNSKVLSIGHDLYMRCWSFQDYKIKFQIFVGGPTNCFSHHRRSSLISISMDNPLVYVYDLTSCNIMCRLEGHSQKISALYASNDPKKLLSSSLDSSLRLWSLKSTKCLQIFYFTPLLTTFALDQNFTKLATIHKDRRGIYTWSITSLTRKLWKSHDKNTNVNFQCISKSSISDRKIENDTEFTLFLYKVQKLKFKNFDHGGKSISLTEDFKKLPKNEILSADSNNIFGTNLVTKDQSNLSRMTGQLIPKTNYSAPNHKCYYNSHRQINICSNDSNVSQPRKIICSLALEHNSLILLLRFGYISGDLTILVNKFLNIKFAYLNFKILLYSILRASIIPKYNKMQGILVNFFLNQLITYRYFKIISSLIHMTLETYFNKFLSINLLKEQIKKSLSQMQMSWVKLNSVFESILMIKNGLY